MQSICIRSNAKWIAVVSVVAVFKVDGVAMKFPELFY
jgi:hypothetical protein